MRRGPSPPLPAIARKRQPTFASAAAARAALGAKPPFSLFAPAALDAYLAHGLRRKTPPAATNAANPSPPAPGSSSTGDCEVELCCSPEMEARVYEALASPPCPEGGWGSTQVPVVVAVGRDDGGLHARLAVAGIALSGELPKGRLHRCARALAKQPHDSCPAAGTALIGLGC